MRKIKLRGTASAVVGIITVVIVWIAYFSFIYYKNKAGNTSVAGIVHPLPPPSEEDHYKWRSRSEYTIVNYFSMDCVHCRRLDDLEDKNKELYQPAFSLVYRQSPLPENEPLSPGKAIIAECVYSQGGDNSMFEFMADFYHHYDEYAINNDWAINMASKYVKDKKELNNCIKGSKMSEQIAYEKGKALSYSVSGVPTVGLFKNGVLILRWDTIGELKAKRLMDYVVTLKAKPLE